MVDFAVDTSIYERTAAYITGDLNSFIWANSVPMVQYISYLVPVSLNISKD